MMNSDDKCFAIFFSTIIIAAGVVATVFVWSDGKRELAVERTKQVAMELEVARLNAGITGETNGVQVIEVKEEE